MVNKKKIIKRTALVSVIVMILFITLSNFWIHNATDKLIYHDHQHIPANDIALLLGTSKYAVNGENLYFKYRIDAAANLYHAGKIKHFIVSGDNHIDYYNEPEQMKKSLIERGVPAEKITCDYAGFRTLDSVIRLKKVFMTSKVTIISQKFHLQRAIFIAKHNGIDAVGYAAEDVSNNYSIKTQIRELLAKPKAVLDVFVLNKQPKFLGEEIKINI